MGLAETYCQDIRNQLEYYATWMPTVMMRLGDYGVIDDKVFSKQGNIREFNVQFQAELGIRHEAPFEYQSQGTNVSSIDAGTGGLINVGLKFAFSKKYGVFFKATDCEQSVMLGQPVIFQTLSQKFKELEMEDYYVVTEVFKAGAFTLVTSVAKNAEFLIEAKNNQVPQIDLEIPNFAYNTKKASNVGYSFVAKTEMTPLIQLKKVNT